MRVETAATLNALPEGDYRIELSRLLLRSQISDQLPSPLMKRCFKLCGLAAMMLGALAHAHEFWMQSSPGAGPGQEMGLQLFVGENFEGDRIGFGCQYLADLKLHSLNGGADLGQKLPQQGVLGTFPLPALPAGIHLVSYDSQPSFIELPADKFHAYLHDEGLDRIIEQRKDAGQEARPGRERYRRNVKHLIRIGGVTDKTYALQTGQRLEIVPQNDPFESQPPSSLRLAVRFDGKPLQNALVKAWHRSPRQTTMLRARTDNGGNASFMLPFTGDWMISVVHMIPAEQKELADWDSFWGNLTFSLPQGENTQRQDGKSVTDGTRKED
ncbi:Uncharacterized conserved protein, contains GH25 family domain [Noviherbaspirillum humi]|uniref:Uncharacterized conserved protein, contains GH25 family domain n=1 Tax=Noviherbaspirillum humi TaxID=1688639 RepID=A0A239IB52_9BURK|nr:DUF4198 domain-containing protein [Noviherbaspirillum humi]SNS91036.1 Uncharacterized conserved protein, contains GH25 family domain [Noviherbaspirillum humi]